MIAERDPRHHARAAAREAIIVTAIVVLAFAIRVAWIAHADFQPTLSDDAGRYHFLGQALADGAGYINPNGRETMFWPPGYPFLLAATYKLWPADAFGAHELTIALLLNATAGALTCALVYAVGRQTFDVGAAIAAAAITALFPSLVFFSGVTLTETLFTFLALLGLWLVVEAEARGRWPLLVSAGLVIGYAALVRGQALLLPFVAAPFWLLATRDLRSTLTRLAGVAALAIAVVAPWTARNWIESGSPVLISSNAGVDFFIGHSDGADGSGRIVDDLVFRYPDLPAMEGEARINRDGFREGLEYAASHPLREVELSARKLFFLYWRDDEGVRWNDGHGERDVFSSGEHRVWVGVSNVYYYAVIALAAGGLALMAARWSARRGGRGETVEAHQGRRLASAAQVLLASVAMYWTLIHVAFFADPRFHAPILPVLALFAGVAAAEATQRLPRVVDRAGRVRQDHAVSGSKTEVP